MLVSCGSFESWPTNVAYSSSGWPPWWQLPAPALNSVSPLNSAFMSERERRQIWLMGVQDLGDFPAPGLGRREAFHMVQGIDGERFSGVGAGDQVVEIAIRISGPDTLDDHCGAPSVLIDCMVNDKRHRPVRPVHRP